MMKTGQKKRKKRLFKRKERKQIDIIFVEIKKMDKKQTNKQTKRFPARKIIPLYQNELLSQLLRPQKINNQTERTTLVETSANN